MTHPYIILRTLDNNITYDIRPATIKRDFLDNTLKSHGYHCQALTTANMHGWEFVLLEDIEVIWDGISDTESHHVKVLSGQNLANGVRVVDTATANSTIAFNLNGFLETDEDHYSLILGPPNHFVDGAKPMTALIRSDWYHHNPLQFCWIITTPNKVVTFKKGTPVMTIMNYPKNLLESTNFYIKEATDEQKEKISNYGKDRTLFYQENPGLKWANMYKKGVDGLGDDANKYIESIYKPKLSKPINE